jgi:predicted GIY-YIG superfamily endonuclease
VTLYAPQRPLDASGRPRGRCRTCRRSCALTRRGNAWQHGARTYGSTLGRCPGAGLPPAGVPGPEVAPLPGQLVVGDRELLAPARPGGTVYLLHLDEPFGHARHYTGWASDLHGRLAHHAAGTGANLLRHVAKAGIGWQLARTWQGDRYLERRIKRRGGATRRCPICRPDLADRLIASIE